MTYVAVGTAAFSIASGVANGVQIARQGEIMQQIANMNADALVQDSWKAETYAGSEAAAYEKEITQTIATQRANMAAKNVDVSFGTAAEIQSETKLTGTLNQMNIVQAGQQKAAGILHEASNVRLQGVLSAAGAQMEAANTQAAGFNSAITTLGNRYAKNSKYRSKAGGVPNDTGYSAGDSYGDSSNIG